MRFVGMILILFAAVFLFYWFQSNHPLLPSGKGSEVFAQTCLKCHGIDVITRESRDQGQWQKIILVMQKLYGMPPLTPENRELIVSYLTTHWGMPEDNTPSM